MYHAHVTIKGDFLPNHISYMQFAVNAISQWEASQKIAAYICNDDYYGKATIDSINTTEVNKYMLVSNSNLFILLP